MHIDSKITKQDRLNKNEKYTSKQWEATYPKYIL